MGFYIGKLFVSYYSVMILVGIAVACILAVPLFKKYRLSFEYTTVVACVVGISIVVGAKLLFLIINYNTLIDTFYHISFDNIVMLIRGGYVFYGGLLMALFVLWFIKKFVKTNYDIEKTIEYIFPLFVIAHGIARIGCRLVGCCYGIKYNGPFYIVYSHSIVAPNGVGLFPTQYVEAFFQIVVGLIFYTLIYRKGSNKQYLYIYLTLYGVMRFFLEFLRGDMERGVLFRLSTSQYISIGLIVFSLVKVLSIKREVIKT